MDTLDKVVELVEESKPKKRTSRKKKVSKEVEVQTEVVTKPTTKDVSTQTEERERYKDCILKKDYEERLNYYKKRMIKCANDPDKFHSYKSAIDRLNDMEVI